MATADKGAPFDKNDTLFKGSANSGLRHASSLELWRLTSVVATERVYNFKDVDEIFESAAIQICPNFFSELLTEQLGHFEGVCTANDRGLAPQCDHFWSAIADELFDGRRDHSTPPSAMHSSHKSVSPARWARSASSLLTGNISSQPQTQPHVARITADAGAVSTADTLRRSSSDKNRPVERINLVATPIMI